VLWITYEMARRWSALPVTVNALCPGFVPSTAAASTTGAMRWFMAHVMVHMPFATSVSQATDQFEFMALDPTLAHVSGRYFMDGVETKSSADSYDEDQARRFWKLASELTGLEAR
jgi:NAD(P)-dependent dehydrogenase (short-subunit alcohol dehydrogenase family)